jgi:hypothetical protein
MSPARELLHCTQLLQCRPLKHGVNQILHEQEGNIKERDALRGPDETRNQIGRLLGDDNDVGGNEARRMGVGFLVEGWSSGSGESCVEE